ncbi:hypothetical protein DXT99_04585 [Pontibacter diazotrophicus]|uniref:Uncharacterized protein n=1 Tax=Pontibacter diazotrophicus TaxID=1400979 RepID=A0A3D8LGE0_9BACT|nr:hypothetical protein [Pontibacter diazotrophicus]RDV16483.1 hypothetical protein DXT99_04585 [Pontibacter diazotrophicus]
MLHKIKLIAIAFCLPLLVSCNTENDQQTAETDAAYQDYQTFVTDFERDSLTETELRAIESETYDSAEWEAMKENRQQQFIQRLQAVEQNQDQYTEEQRQEILDLENRYNQAAETRDQQYEDASRRYRLRRELLGLEINQDDLSDITQENIAGTYQRFVDTVAEKGQNYEGRDWEMIEGWWTSLNNRYRSLQGELPQQSRNTIEQAQERYRELRSQFNIQ